MANKKEKIVKVPKYLVTAGTKKARVIFEDLTEGFVKTEGRVLELPKLSKDALKKLRATYVHDSVASLCASYPSVVDL